MAASIQELINWFDTDNLVPNYYRNPHVRELAKYIIAQREKEPAYVLSWANYRQACYDTFFSEPAIREHFVEKFKNTNSKVTEYDLEYKSMDELPKLVQARATQEWLFSMYPDIVQPRPTRTIYWVKPQGVQEEEEKPKKGLQFNTQNIRRD